MTTSPKMEQALNQAPSGEHWLHPMVSIIMPVYNGAPYIAKAVRSVLQQTYPFWELIVVNDGSTDSTLDILAAFDDPRIQVVSQPNGGTATARNHAMGLAQGEFMALLDADDLWLPTKLAHDIALLDALTRQGQSTEVVVYGWFYGIDDVGHLANFSAPFTQTGLLFEPQLLEEKTMLYNSCLLFHRTVYDTLGGYQPGLYHEDLEFILRMSRQYPAFCTRQRLTLIRQTTDGKCRGLLKDYDRARHEQLAILDYFQDGLTPEIRVKAALLQQRNLFYRFLMYGYPDFAWRLADSLQTQSPEIRAVLFSGLKGRLALLSQKTGINWLLTIRVILQTLYKTVYAPWWHHQTKALRS